jgi:hypothetical protein
MRSKATKRGKAGRQQINALARWQGEGGAAAATAQTARERRATLAGEEERVVRCLGAAVIMQWNELPTGIQRTLFEHAVSMGEPRYTVELKEQIARFLHKHKRKGR